MGGLALTRENALLLVAAVLLWPPGRLQFSSRQRAMTAAVFVLGLSLVLFPVAVRNRIVGGEWHLTTSQLGSNLYIGNNPNADGTYAALREGRGTAEYERLDATELAETGLDAACPSGGFDFWVRETMKFVRTQLRVVDLMAGKPRSCGTAPSLSTREPGKLRRWHHCFALWRTSVISEFSCPLPFSACGDMERTFTRRRLLAMTASLRVSVVVFYVSLATIALVPLRMPLLQQAGSFGSFVRTASSAKVVLLRLHLPRGASSQRPILSAEVMRAPRKRNLGVALQTDQKLEEAERTTGAPCYRADLRSCVHNPRHDLVALNRPTRHREPTTRERARISGRRARLQNGNAWLQAAGRQRLSLLSSGRCAADKRSASSITTWASRGSHGSAG